ncbi:hypothetical protein CORT_0H02430 [Candida orthopsilosis Co 90-125]|uniref:Oxidant-induced cell-cycle arrest protein 5 n=1 Tax=Candida orthopsilosis (strain 90-125) TaxID=1136231 RepID=H8XBA4_CANO9|nr:hypothetical protein CORT_0H02430 [Candida orthopsilosis Co 90-125]CCG25353.1 hypothetical protein CORT_0H02430 [Candida orthopsilosis Co 90-125]
MIDFESLLEFEESLSQGQPNLDNSAILHNFEAKIEHLRFKEEQQQEGEIDSISSTSTPSSTSSSIPPSLDQVIAAYDITQDEFATCVKCGTNLSLNTTSKASCCQATITRTTTISSNLESLYWTSFIDNPTRTINTLPHYTELVLKQGIPNCIRSYIWKKIFLLSYSTIPKSISLVYANFQHSYSLEVSQQISKDLTRTFPTVSFFQKQSTIDDLSTILNVYANYDLELGYCQGLLFLVGVLYHHLQSCELTFYALTTIMETELELHDIFTAQHMSNTLNLWFYQFSHILKIVDSQLYIHLDQCQVDMQIFLYQWWLSFMSSHTADLSIINRVMDFCQFEGWKIGMMKISLGLLIVNKPILMTLDQGDEEVVYQHLLNETKWGNVANDLDLFFGDFLFSWDDELFMNPPSSQQQQQQQQHNSNVDSNIVSATKSQVSQPQSSLLSTFKSLSLNLKSKSPMKHSTNTLRSPYTGLSRERSSTTTSNNSGLNTSMITSTTSVFSTSNHTSAIKNGELDSIYSDVSEVSSQQSGNDVKSFTDYLKLPSFGSINNAKRNELGDNLSKSNSSSSNSRESLLMNENEALRYLLKQAYDTLGNDGVGKKDVEVLKSQIEKMVI